MHRFAAVLVAWVLGMAGASAQAGGEQQDAPSAAAQPLASGRLPSLTPLADWGPFFADWERTCSPSAEMQQLVAQVQQERRLLPVRYRSQIRHFTPPSAQSDGWYRLALAGTYQGVPVKALLWREAQNPPANEYRLLVDVPLDAAFRVPSLDGRKVRAVHVQPGERGLETSIVCFIGD